MTYTFNIALNIHFYSVIIMIVILISNMIFSVLKIDYFGYIRYVRNITPMYALALSFVVFTGIVMMGITKEGLNIYNGLMILNFISCLMLEIKRNKRLKVSKLKDVSIQKKYKFYAIKMYAYQLFFILSLTYVYV